MLDPKIIRDGLDKISDMLKARNVQLDLDVLEKINTRRLEMITKTDTIRKNRNQIGNEISMRKKSGKDVTDVMNKMKSVVEELKNLEAEQEKIDAEFSRMALKIPNLVDKSVPIGDESANKEIRRWGDIPKFDFEPKNHIDISEVLDVVDLQRAAKVSAARFYYLKNDLVRLNQALISYALDFLGEKNYQLLQPPYMINRQAMQGAIIADDFEDVIYKIDGEDLYMIGTSEHAMAAMHSNEIIEEGLPIRYAGTSPCFRKEAGAHGRDQKGIFRVHQFDKIEQFVFSKPEESWKEHERMLQIAEEFYQSLKIPHRTILLSSMDMGKVSAKTYDIEAWMAGQNAFREVVSCSNCLDYQARRLKIRFRDRTDEQTQYLHTLNSTLVATSRVLVSIMENFQAKDGHIAIPQVLQKYMKNQKEI